MFSGVKEMTLWKKNELKNIESYAIPADFP